MFFRKRPSDIEIQRKVYYEELEKIRVARKEVAEQLEELRNALSSLKEDLFIREVLPNSTVILAVLEYGSMADVLGSTVLKILVSLFKQIQDKNKDFLGLIERSIAYQFGEDLEVLDSTSLDTLSFMLDKIFKLLRSRNVEVGKKKIKDEVVLQYRMKTTKKERMNLERQKDCVAELQEYVVDDVVVKLPTDLRSFHTLLIKAGLNEEEQSRYMSLIDKQILDKEYGIDEEKLEKFLTVDEILIWKKAYLFYNGLLEGSIKDLLKRMILDVVSIVRYLDMGIDEDIMHDSYQTIDEKIVLIQELLEQALLDREPANLFGYLCDHENVPVMMRNLEGIDILKYDDVLRTLIRLAQGEVGTIFLEHEKISYGVLEGEKIILRYAKCGEDIVVLGVCDKTLANVDLERHAIVHEQIKNIFGCFYETDYRKCQEIYENLIVRMLDLKTIDVTSSLKKMIKT